MQKSWNIFFVLENKHRPDGVKAAKYFFVTFFPELSVSPQLQHF